MKMYETRYHSEDLGRYSFLITGGAGFIGANIARYLLINKAKKVRVLDNFSTGYLKNIEEFIGNPAFELAEGDIRDLATCSKAIKGIDFVSHQAALGSVPRSINDPLTTNEVNINGFLNMLTASKDARVKNFVYAASSSTYGDHPGLPKVEDKIGEPLSPYAVTKYVNELYAAVFSKTYNFHSIGLRYFNVFGPGQSPEGAYAAVIPLFIEAALNDKAPVIYGNGETSRDFTFIENVVQANIKALLKPGILQHEIVNIACGQQITLNELWNAISNISGAKKMPVYKDERTGDIRYSLASIEKAGIFLDYKPLFDVKTGLEISVRYYASARRN